MNVSTSQNLKLRNPFVFIIIILLSLQNIHLKSQDAQENADTLRLKLYLDCYDCNFDYFRRNLSYVDFVRDPKVSDLHLLVTEQRTASNGRSYGFNFIGNNDFSDINYKLKAFSYQSDTEIETWERLMETTKMGLMPFISRTSESQNMLIKYAADSSYSELQSEIKDSWNYWVFRLDFGGNLNIEESQNEFSEMGAFRIDRITEKLKFRADISYFRSRAEFIDDEETIESLREELDSDLELVYSLGPRWSIGAFSEIKSSSYQNIDFSYSFSPAIEYNIFPWDESDRKVFSIAYQLEGRYFNYNEPTIYDKTSEIRALEAIKLSLRLIQAWGEIDTELEGSHYFHDFSKNSLNLESRISVNVTKGLSIFTELEGGLIHDQIYLPAGEVSREELLLRLTKLESAYSVSAQFGFTFTFGSIYNNIVNRRL